jgi:uncharacterized membrane protein
MSNQDPVNQLLEKLNVLLKQQDDFSRSINQLRNEINQLRQATTQPDPEKVPSAADSFAATTTLEITNTTPAAPSTPAAAQRTRPPARTLPVNFEKFIGENLINKIGIAITVIGVAIGAKYSIDNDLVSPLLRIILGYLAGIGLLGFGIRLKDKYPNYSAVLVSGAIAIMYFITYAAYGFYDLIPQVLAFALMVVFTAFTVVAALNYDKPVIAHIGLVGAYAIPYLLSSGSGNVAILFSYMAIINVGILIISFKKYWKSLYYASFGLTWLMYASWYLLSYRSDEYFSLALTFLTVFFATFYLTYLVYNLRLQAQFKRSDILLLLANSFLFYGLGYVILGSHQTGDQFLGLFTLGNALIHFLVSALIYRQKLADKKVFYFVSGLVLVFITIAIPVQLEGNWVILFWAGEAALLFGIGRIKSLPVFEKLAYPIMVLAFFSLVIHWLTAYSSYYSELPETRITPLFNSNFLTSLLFVAAFGFILFLQQNKRYPAALDPEKGWGKIASLALPAIFLFTLYYAFQIELTTYWDQLYTDSALDITPQDQEYTNYYQNEDLPLFKIIWTINYALFFFAALSFANNKWLRNPTLGIVNLGLNTLAIATFLTTGIAALSALRNSYVAQPLQEYYHHGAFNIGIRYLAFALVALTLFACYQYLRQGLIKLDLKLAFDVLLHVSILAIVSNELVNWMDIAGSTQSYKLGLSILWGGYALMLIALGLWKKQKHLRLGAMALFGATLVKLFFYDIADLNTISKTIVFVSLGVLLLIISFLYNKYKYLIADEVED